MDNRFLDWHLAEDLSKQEKFALVKIMEEAAELSQAAAKLLTWGPTNWNPLLEKPITNIEHLRAEWADLCAAMSRFDGLQAPPPTEEPRHRGV